MTDSNHILTPRNSRAFWAMRREYSIEDDVPSTGDNLEDSLAMLSEELDALGIKPVIAEGGDTTESGHVRSIESLTDTAARLIDASWKLVHKYRSLARLHDQLNDTHSKISNDNTNLKKRVERLKGELGKKEDALQKGLERERRLRVQCDGVSRDLKHEKEETIKLKKQSKSKDNQHAHELRRVAQNAYKLRDQSQRVTGCRISNGLEKSQSESEEKLDAYKRTILRLEENNRLMLHEVNDLKEALSLCSVGIDLQIEASGIWTDTET